MAESGVPTGGGGLEEQRAVRLAKLEALQAEGIVPFADRFARTHDLAGVRRAAEATEGTPAADAPLLRSAGRVMTVRPFGRLVFFHLQDGSGRCQVALDEKDVGADVIARFSRFVDLGDHIGVEGRVGRTKKGEPTLFATSWTFLSKALRPLPEKWKGLGDLEARQRERYLDLVSNPDTRARFRLRTRFVRELRRYLDDHGFEEVDTPVLQTKASGALARPFHSHHNALDMAVVLRIAPETWLKQCVAGGLDRVYEIARCFRNEGMDPSHLQDFTLVEWYAAYWDYRDNMAFTESLILHLLDEVVGSRIIEHGGRRIDFTTPWPVRPMRDLIRDDCGIDVEAHPTADGLRAAIRAAAIRLERDDLDVVGRGTLIDLLYKKVSRPKLIDPVFVTEHPIDLSPLARRSDSAPLRTDRYQLVVNTWEVVNAYSELVDPIDQRQRFEAQASARAGGDDEALEVDEDYLKCMEHGMPPMSGWGMGLERFLALVTDQENLREVVLFPLMRPLAHDAGEAAPAASAEPTNETSSIDVSDIARAAADDVEDLGVDEATARALFDEWVTTPSLRRQMEMTRVVMGALARHRGANEEAWRLVGLLHNLDYDREKDPRRHTLVAAEVLRDAGMHPAALHAICAHNDKNLEGTGIVCTSALDHALSASEAVVGLIHAAAQVLPTRSISDLEVKSAVKRHRDAKFAATVERDLIERSGALGLSLEAFYELAIDALKAEPVD
ncbi:MAG: lysine--tRNA ligase [Planctomycetota bacterium]